MHPTLRSSSTDLTGLSLASSGSLVKDEYSIRMDCDMSPGGGAPLTPSGVDQGGPGPSGLSSLGLQTSTPVSQVGNERWRLTNLN